MLVNYLILFLDEKISLSGSYYLSNISPVDKKGETKIFFAQDDFYFLYFCVAPRRESWSVSTTTLEVVVPNNAQCASKRRYCHFHHNPCHGTKV